VESWRSVTLAPGETLRCGMLSAGRVGYVALAGIRVPQQLGSASTYARARLGGLDGRLLTPAAQLLATAGSHGERRGCGRCRLMPRQQFASSSDRRIITSTPARSPAS
jgi:allophanate hydrolase subunit 2